jgi:predicted RNA binding protein YcfA (HicA-like mRNA interferase family)
MKWNELKRIAIAHGFVFNRNRGNHDEYINRETGQRILIERHWSQEVRTGLLNSLKKIIGF